MGDDDESTYREIAYFVCLLRHLKEDEIELYKRKAAEDNYHSNAIEGSRVTFKETVAILNNLGDTIGKYHLSEKREITDYAAAQRFMLAAYAERAKLDMVLIADMHYYLLKEANPEFAGHIRGYGEEVVIGGKDVGLTEGANVWDKLAELLDWYAAQSRHGVEGLFKLAVEFKYRFLRIHPFNDGNGRMSRLLLNYILLSHKMFPLVVQVQDRDQYMQAIDQAVRNDDMDPYFKALSDIYLRELKAFARDRKPC